MSSYCKSVKNSAALSFGGGLAPTFRGDGQISEIAVQFEWRGMERYLYVCLHICAYVYIYVYMYIKMGSPPAIDWVLPVDQRGANRDTYKCEHICMCMYICVYM